MNIRIASHETSNFTKLKRACSNKTKDNTDFEVSDVDALIIEIDRE